MIVVHAADPTVRRAALRAASPEEDVIMGAAARAAVEWGFPRIVVRGPREPPNPIPSHLTVLDVDETTLRAWEADRRALELPPTRAEYVAERVARAVEARADRRTRVDRMLADLSRAAGTRLPSPFRGFARRVLEFPWHYRTLHSLADAGETTRGALKARFRRRGLPSPAIYLRWLRLLAVSSVLSDRSITVSDASHRMGFTSAGNLCRSLRTVAGVTATESRTPAAFRSMLVAFAAENLDEEALEAWATLEDLFRRAA